LQLRTSVIPIALKLPGADPEERRPLTWMRCGEMQIATGRALHPSIPKERLQCVGVNHEGKVSPLGFAEE
jgi:hypothetical protein